MKVVVQRVSQASVSVQNEVVGEIGCGLLILVGVGREDSESDAKWLAEKCATLRIFEDEQGKMNRSVQDCQGSVLIVSQFTLYGDCRKGRRPSFVQAADPESGNRLYEFFCTEIRKLEIPVATGQFQAQMAVSLVNQGPVTILIDSESRQQSRRSSTS